MAKIENSSPKNTSGGYERLVGNAKLAGIFTKAQSTVITNGTELEKIISSRANCIKDLDEFIQLFEDSKIADGGYLCTKKVLKKSSYYMQNHEPDFLVFTVNGKKDFCSVVEMKDGDSFDTKKAPAEKEMLKLFVNHIAPKIPFRTKLYICCFNQDNKEKIVEGFKKNFTVDEVMSGREFCELLNIDYDSIVSMRKKDAVENFAYVVKQMADIPEICTEINQRQKSVVIEDEFYGEDDDT